MRGRPTAAQPQLRGGLAELWQEPAYFRPEARPPASPTERLLRGWGHPPGSAAEVEASKGLGERRPCGRPCSPGSGERHGRAWSGRGREPGTLPSEGLRKGVLHKV